MKAALSEALNIPQVKSLSYLYSQLYIDQGQGFSEFLSMQFLIIKAKNQVHFRIYKTDLVKELKLRLDPVNRASFVKISNIKVKDSQLKEHKISINSSNGLRFFNYFYFYKSDPNIFMSLDFSQLDFEFIDLTLQIDVY